MVEFDWTIEIAGSQEDLRGAGKENVFLALDNDSCVLGKLYMYPFSSQYTVPEHHHNIFIHLEIAAVGVLKEQVKDALLEMAITRASEIKSIEKHSKTRLYACYFKHQQDEINYYLSRGFYHDEGMLILEAHLKAPLPKDVPPEDICIQPWQMYSEKDQQQFIEIHREIFPRHPYSIDVLGELKEKHGWNNFTAFYQENIVGNIMIYTFPIEGCTIGWIEDLFVSKDWRRMGIARCLLNTALQHFLETGIKVTRLEVWSANSPAFNLYNQYGFHVIDETEIALGKYV